MIGAAPLVRFPLKDNWSFSQVPSEHCKDVEESWSQCEIPTSVHVELKKLGKIPDPYKDLNEWRVQWIQEGDWVFKTAFDIDDSTLESRHVDLVFEGLDTYCSITLEVAITENMFLSHRVSVKDILKAKTNQLILHFKSPWHGARQAEEHNGGPMHLSQYGWGWDWGPVMMTVGPWKPIRVETYDVRLDDIRVDAVLSGSHFDRAKLATKVTLSDNTQDCSLVITLLDTDGNVIRAVDGHSPFETLQWDLGSDVKGWYPRGYGSQPLYQLKVELKNQGLGGSTRSREPKYASCLGRRGVRSERAVRYPSYPELNASIKIEAEQAVTRLRDHPSVVIFAGNNEDYALAESIGVMDYTDNSGDYMKSKFPARHIYEVLLPEVVERLSNVFYHRSSPYGGKDSSDQTVGDIHQWNVWHGTQEPWANWDKLAGRFVSEFGMQGYPNLRTVNEWSDDKNQLFPQSRVSVNHNKADGFERRLELYLMENFRHAFDMPSYIYYTQIMQAECLGAAYRLWRRNFKGRGREYTSGALVWQINDCWPCVSWAIADYYLRPKELKPYTVGMTRKDIKTRRNKTTSAFFDTHEELPANASTEIWTGKVPGQLVRSNDAQVPKPIVVHARLNLSSESNITVARFSSWPEPYKYLTVPDPGLKVKVQDDNVTLSCEKPLKGLVLDVDGDDCEWSDQALDLFPDDDQVVQAKGLNGRSITYRYIGDGSA
ncbi:uncharacterized protein IL334_006901 [Kwoniella shivajii]|uniref:beta-mannosidase n=1 Tax=Kwoniella shivajii TaxID=564305 RepID=A0ABZ1D788_9TREE|nr:hypothetical protein IL334_006901 [Kwoniella shivajii]